MGRFRILLVSDSHGSEPSFRKFLDSIAVCNPDLCVDGGDWRHRNVRPDGVDTPIMDLAHARVGA